MLCLSSFYFYVNLANNCLKITDFAQKQEKTDGFASFLSQKNPCIFI